MSNMSHGRSISFRVKSIGVLVTFPLLELSTQDIEDKAKELNCVAVMSVVEYHKTLVPHTHAVFYKEDEFVWTRAQFQMLSNNPNIKRLRTTRDVYRAMAYLGKAYIPNLWLAQPQHASREYGRVLSTVWESAVTSTDRYWHDKYMSQWTRLNAAWTPAFDSQDSERDVISENASQFFPSQ